MSPAHAGAPRMYHTKPRPGRDDFKLERNEDMTPKELAVIAAKALDEKKGKEISAIEVTEQTTLADYFVIATGTSNTQINALCGAVEKAMAEQAGEDPLRREGYRPSAGRATGTAPGSCWITAAWWSMCSLPRPGSSTPWSVSGMTASPWT